MCIAFSDCRQRAFQGHQVQEARRKGASAAQTQLPEVSTCFITGTKWWLELEVPKRQGFLSLVSCCLLGLE